ncbi:TlpA disulfide reductase family protein [Pedobacter aquatilis]|uniref:TlpA family protein disulfide reductase n=1 Tax=Pedobacter aquatilis TaxID=351343 RepID=UPI0025B438E9|nr:TlpA disulfide reductase family protein [Pedobacter aquatilis]MDN3588186.1 TlpA disulfide reductase family protein [Pedobacter aquatilis]
MNTTIKLILFCGFTTILPITSFPLPIKPKLTQVSRMEKKDPGAPLADPDSTSNKPAPDFTLKDISGKSVSLTDFRGKVVILDFWASWCIPCRQSFPAVKLAMETYKDSKEVQFLFIDTRETSADYKNLAEKFLKENGYNFEVLFDEFSEDGKMNKYYLKSGLIGIPTKIFIDKKGIIRAKSIGFRPGQTDQEAANELCKEIENLIK